MKVRLQKFMADCGVAGRRECEQMIADGKVRVNGAVRTEMPVMIDPEKDQVMLGDEIVEGLRPEKQVYYLLNKPKGILVTNYDPSERKTVGELMKGVKERVFPVGRLDMDSRGALIMTNDGELANRLTHPRHGVEKTYIVEVEGRLSPGDVDKIKRGVWLGPEFPGARGGAKTERFKVKVLGRERGKTIMEIKISEGKNREIRRAMARVGHPVRDLNRVAIGGKVTTKGLDVGEMRPLTEEEVKWLYHASSPEYQERERSATQRWFEEKEMAKEKKRLEKVAAEPPPPLPPPAPPRRTPEQERAAARKEFRKAPVRKGKKPFVPPTGRNAGVPLGGSRRNREAILRQIEMNQGLPDVPDRGTPEDRPAPPARPSPRGPEKKSESHHPLGDAARRDE